MSTRDFQRKRVYDAEDIVGYADSTLGERLETVPEMQRWVDGIVGSKWFRNRWPYLTNVQVRDGRGRRTATGYARGGYWRNKGIAIQTEGVLKMPKWSRCEMVILHELTHVIVDHEYNHKVPAHGKEFCGTYLGIVRRFMGAGWHSALKGAFKIEKVKHRMVST